MQLRMLICASAIQTVIVQTMLTTIQMCAATTATAATAATIAAMIQLVLTIVRVTRISTNKSVMIAMIHAHGYVWMVAVLAHLLGVRLTFADCLFVASVKNLTVHVITTLLAM